MTPHLIRSPKLVLQAAIYTRITTTVPALATSFYAVPPLRAPFPFAEFGHYSARWNPQWMDGKHWDCVFVLGFHSQVDSTAEIDGLMDSALQALTLTEIPLTDGWSIYQIDLDGEERGQLAWDEFGPLHFGTLAIRFGIQDT